jgi:hypothetical protein
VVTFSGAGLRVQTARKPGSGRPLWLVLGEDCLPIQPIDEFLTFHDASLVHRRAQSAPMHTTSSSTGST